MMQLLGRNMLINLLQLVNITDWNATNVLVGSIYLRCLSVETNREQGAFDKKFLCRRNVGNGNLF